MSWCDFCQTTHSSSSFYHPGAAAGRAKDNRIAELEAERDEAQDALSDMTVERLRAKQTELAENGGCPCCLAGDEEGHILGCELAAAEAERCALRDVTSTVVLDCISDEAENLTVLGTDYVKWADVKTVVASCLRARWTNREGDAE